jgi:excisionase family DNA binding protein
MEDRLMTVKQLSAYLNVNERTALKLVADGTVPGVKIGSQWRFRKAMIDTWLDDQMLGVLPRYLSGPPIEGAPRRMLDLKTCFQPDHIISKLTAQTKNGVIEELSGLAHRLGFVRDTTWFVGALIQRENVFPGAVGGGVAFLHTLRRNPEQIARPFMVLGRSLEGVEFDALDGKPTHLFFVLGLKYDELHLPWLYKLSQMLVREPAVKDLLKASDTAAIYETLVQAERTLEPEFSARVGV